MFPINNHPNMSPRSDNAPFRKQFKIIFWVFCIDLKSYFAKSYCITVLVSAYGLIRVRMIGIGQ
jgi:hypothetical protein